MLITGASGLLGRCVVAAFADSGAYSVIAASFSRDVPFSSHSHVQCVRLDLRAAADTLREVQRLQPTVIVHCAAERRPDVCERAPAEAEALNVEAVWTLARAASSIGGGMLHISTDYIFDGTAPPYAETAVPNPLNAYGAQKLRGEYAALAGHANAVVLRVPVIFGPTADLMESAVTAFAPMAVDATAAKKLDDWQIRVPTYAPDIAATVLNMVNAMRSQHAPLRGIYHYSSDDCTTRYKLALLFGELLGVPTAHITGDAAPPPGAPRPHDAKLDCTKLRSLGLAAPCTSLRDALLHVLAPFKLGVSTRSRS